MNKIARNKKILLLLAGAFIIRLILSGFGTLALDQNTFISWGKIASEGGLNNFYNGWSDYLPGYIYVLVFLAKIEPLLGISSTVLYKMPAILFDLATGYLIYHILKKKEKLALIASAAFLFNPAVFANSTLWGQVDVITCFFALLAVYSINKWPISAFSLAMGSVVKPQAIMAAPVVFILALKQRWGIKKLILYGVMATVVGFLLFLPFTNLANLARFILERLNATMGQYPYGSVNAFNFWGLWGFWKEDGGGLISAKNVGTLALVGIGIFALLNRKLAEEKPYHFLAIMLLANFLLFTRMHERHLLPALAPLAIAAAITPVLWVAYIGFSLSYIANMYYSYQWITQDFFEVFPEAVVKLFIIANLIFFAIVIKQSLSPSSGKLTILLSFIKKAKFSEKKFKDRLSKKQEKRLLVAILLFSLAVRLFRLEVPQTDYFDEIYHAFTARQMLAGDPKPWHWSSAHPEGFAYEWTHPPVAKEIMAGSMSLFGVNSLAWRLPGAISGVFIIFAVWAIARKLFGSRDIAILSAFLISLDGLVLTMSRIGTADTYFVAFAMLALYLFLEKRDFASAVFLGLAAATKWSTLWVFPVFVVAFLLLRLRLKPSLLWFFVIPPLIYVASYTPMFYFGHNLETFWGMQKQMWWYHSGLVATHPYTSPWWSWPIMQRPVYLYQNYESGMVANIYAFGNPFFFWSGLVAMFFSIYLFIKERSAALGVLVFGYFALFAPWALSPRIMFVYHYLPSLPIMAIVLAYVLKRYPKLVAPILILITVSFVYFYPHWTAIVVPEWWDKTYYWFSSWR